MNIERTFKHYCEILDEIIDNYDYFKYYFQYPVSIEDVLGEYETNWLNNIDIRFGISRGCIIDRGYGTVVKFNLYDCEGEPFELCEKEERIYKLAERSNFSKYLAECKYLGTYKKVIQFYPMESDVCGEFGETFDSAQVEKWMKEQAEDGMEMEEIYISIPLYGYEEVETGDSSGRPATKAPARYRQSPLGQRNGAIAVAFADYYGETEFHDFTEFCELVGINDLHLGNVCITDSDVILIDYAGYHDHNSYDY